MLAWVKLGLSTSRRWPCASEEATGGFQNVHAVKAEVFIEEQAMAVIAEAD